MQTTDETIKKIVYSLNARRYEPRTQPQKDALALIILLLDDIRYELKGGRPFTFDVPTDMDIKFPEGNTCQLTCPHDEVIADNAGTFCAKCGEHVRITTTYKNF